MVLKKENLAMYYPKLFGNFSCCQFDFRYCLPIEVLGWQNQRGISRMDTRILYVLRNSKYQ